MGGMKPLLPTTVLKRRRRTRAPSAGASTDARLLVLRRRNVPCVAPGGTPGESGRPEGSDAGPACTKEPVGVAVVTAPRT